MFQITCSRALPRSPQIEESTTPTPGFFSIHEGSFLFKHLTKARTFLDADLILVQEQKFKKKKKNAYRRHD